MNLLVVQVRFGEGLKRYPFGVAKRYKRKARPANAVSGATQIHNENNGICTIMFDNKSSKLGVVYLCKKMG